jgi:thiamine pyrophosphate-dependent acetolactate synthase large subunit-like protein
MQVHDVVTSTVVAHDVRTVFGLMGDANMLFVTDFIIKHDGRFVGAVDERNSVVMAGGYAAATGRIGVATITHGPGLTHATTSLVELARGTVPVVVITGEPPGVRDFPQWSDMRALASFAGVGYERVWSPETASDDTTRAFRRAAAERRPIILDVPRDLLGKEAGELRTVTPVTATPQRIRPDLDALDRALGIAVSAKRPVVLAGRGAVWADAHDAIVELADLLGAPLTTSLLAKDWFRGHPLDLGISGTVSTPVAIDRLANADCVIAFGASLNQFTTDRGRLFGDAGLVQVDVSPHCFGDWVPVSEAVLGDARLVAEEMVQNLKDAGIEAPPRDEALAAAVAAYSPFDEFTDASTAETIDVRIAMSTLNRLVPKRRNVVTDIGRAMFIPWKFLDVDDPRGFVAASHFTSIGLALGTAVGVATARPDRPTVATIGDGGFMQSVNELRTAVNERLPLIVVISNDGAYGAEWRKLKLYGVDPSYSRNRWPDFATLAEAHGAHGVTVRTVEDLEKLEPQLQEPDGPIVIDLRLDPDLVPEH